MGNRFDTPTDENASPKKHADPGSSVDRSANTRVTSTLRNGGMSDDTQIDEGDDIEEPTRDLGEGSGDMERPERTLGGDRGIE